MGKQVTELDTLPSFTDTSLLPVHNGAGLKKGSLSQLANYLGNKFSNPNLLINPDFKINQRGKSTYSSSEEIYTVDRWSVSNSTTIVNSDGTITISPLSGLGYCNYKEEGILYGKHAYSIYVQAITGDVTAYYRNKDDSDIELGTLKQGLNTFTPPNNDGFKRLIIVIQSGVSVTLKYVKVEQGTVATPFVAPNPTEELVKCLRFSRYIPILFCTPYRRYASEITTPQAYYLPSGCAFENKLRTKGTITVGGVYDTTGASITNVKSIEYSTDEIRAITLSEPVNNYIIMLKKVFIDAEVY